MRIERGRHGNGRGHGHGRHAIKMMAMMGGAGQPTVMSSGGMAGMQTMHAMTGPS